MKITDTPIHRLPVIGSIATMPTRAETFSKMFPGMLQQVDRLYVYLDGFSEIPAILKRHPACFPMLLPKEGSLRVSSRFLAPIQFGTDALIVFFDDDILYPPDYVTRIKNALARYGPKAIVGFHGSHFQPPYRSYVRDRNTFHFSKKMKSDCTVHTLGCGTSAFLSSVFKPNPTRWRHYRMNDLYMAAEASKLDIRLIALKRKKGWIKALQESQEDSIWHATKNDDSLKSDFMRDLVMQHSMPNREKWWKSDELD